MTTIRTQLLDAIEAEVGRGRDMVHRGATHDFTIMMKWTKIDGRLQKRRCDGMNMKTISGLRMRRSEGIRGGGITDTIETMMITILMLTKSSSGRRRNITDKSS